MVVYNYNKFMHVVIVVCGKRNLRNFVINYYNEILHTSSTKPWCWNVLKTFSNNKIFYSIKEIKNYIYTFKIAVD